LEGFAAEVAANGWATFNLAGALTVALPAGLLAPSADDPDRMELRSASGDLVFRILFGTWPEAREMHAWMLDSHAGAEPPYQSARDDRIVSSIEMGNGKRVYLRSALVDGVAVSLQVVSEPWQRLRADLIASSMQWGTAPDLAPRPGGPLEAVMIRPLAPPDLSQLPGRPQPPPKVVPPMAPATALVGTGTGFYVNNTDIVTAAHVVENCRETRLEDGSALRLLGSDPELDLAVLSAEHRSDAWLPIAAAEGPRLGEPVFALGFPFYGSDIMANQGLSVTGGNVSALPRVSDAASRIMISAPVQPGNSGGPLLSDGGAVLGVVVARVDDLYTLEHQGSLPQNMNYATSVQQLVPFLQSAHVLFPSAPDTPALDLSAGIPDEVQAAVVLIACY
jgi:S1-C subfamily serine protease